MLGVSQWLREVDPREQTILRSRYGLTEDPNKATLQSLADQLGLSASGFVNWKSEQLRSCGQWRVVPAWSMRLDMDCHLADSHGGVGKCGKT